MYKSQYGIVLVWHLYFLLNPFKVYSNETGLFLFRAQLPISLQITTLVCASLHLNYPVWFKTRFKSGFSLNEMLPVKQCKQMQPQLNIYMKDHI